MLDMEAFEKENAAFIEALRGHDHLLQLQAIQHFQKFLNLNDAVDVHRFFIGSNLYPILIYRANDDGNRDLQLDSLRLLVALLGGATIPQRSDVVEFGIVPILLRVISPNSTDDVIDQAVKALGYIIAISSLDIRDAVLASDAMPRLFSMIKEETDNQMLEDIAQLFPDLFRIQPRPGVSFVRLVVPHLINFLNLPTSSEEVIKNILWTFSLIVIDGPRQQRDYIIAMGVLTRVVNFLQRYSDRFDIIHPAIRILGSTAAGDDYQRKAVVTCGALPYFLPLLSCQDETLVKDVCRTISNIASGGTVQQFQAIIDHNLISKLIELSLSKHQMIRKEAIWTLSNLSNISLTNIPMSILLHQDERHSCSPGLLLMLLGVLRNVRGLNRAKNDRVYRQGIALLIRKQLIEGLQFRWD